MSLLLHVLQELQEAGKWLDDWETYVQALPESKQKLFLSRPTCQGLRVTLKSALELSTELLSHGYSYVLTGKFCQDPLEVSIAEIIYYYATPVDTCLYKMPTDSVEQRQVICPWFSLN